VFITGAFGMLGKDISELFACQPEYEVFAFYRKELNFTVNPNIHLIQGDLRDLTLIADILNKVEPNIIIHCAALVNVDGCEDEKDYAMFLHSEIVKMMSMQIPSAKLVFISTDSIFDGIEGNYKESDVPAPLNFYAESKYSGELNTLSLNPFNLVVRTNIYGFHFDKMPSLGVWAIENLSGHKKMIGFGDVYFNPVYTKQLSAILLQLIRKDYSGIINIAADKMVSKYQFLVLLADKFGYNRDLVELDSVEKMQFRAKRPTNTTLNTSLLKSIVGRPPSLDKGLEMFFTDYRDFNNRKL
jgi:dTDP-4-dehydrorhamnose reductase